MTLQLINCEQGSPEWVKARLGIPTASEFKKILAEGRDGEDSKTRHTYMMKLVGERMTGQQMFTFQNEHMERGKGPMEDEARRLYEFHRNVDCKPVGFAKHTKLVRSGAVGCSPDSLVGRDGALEIKTKLAHLQCALLDGPKKVPSEHYAQCQGVLWITGRRWIDFVSYWPKLQPFIVRLRRDERFIARLAREVDAFLREAAAIEKRLRRYKVAA